MIKTKRKRKRSAPRQGPRQGTVVVWASGVEDRYGISAPTRWRWEKTGRLPKRDVDIGGKTGWRPETLAAAETPKLSA
jgi:predicted DNA-binding transcriptional regulator AlpA